jgi:hypothetical protein
MAVNVSSFLAGAGTLIVTMAVGFGGGILLTDAIVGKSEAQQPGQLQQQGREAISAAQPAAAVVPTSPAEERPVVQAVAIRQPPVAEAKPQTGAFTSSQAARPAGPEDAQAKANEAEIQREARRQEHVKRAQSKASAERKRRKSEAMRAMANRAKREDPNRVAERDGQEQARQPEVNFGRRPDDGNSFGGPFRMN